MRSDHDWEELSPSSDDDDSDVGIGVAPRRSSFSYYRLPEQFLKLSVHKLDGTSFEVQTARTATVSELKRAVEDVFKDYSKKGGGMISWSHVWSHFCLCYEDHKLVDNRACLKNFGIKDGDQLHFIRHLSVNLSPIKRRPKNHRAVVERNVMALTGPEVLRELEKKKSNDKNDDNSTSSSQYGDEQCHNFDDDDQEDDLVVGRTEFRFAHLLRGWLSYSRLRSSRRTRSEDKIRPPRPGSYF